MMRRQDSRPENAIAYATLSAFCFAALPEGSSTLGALGHWASLGLHTAFGTVSWVAPVWCADAARRAYIGEACDPKRIIGRAFYVLIACITFDLFHGHGGWVGAKVDAMLSEAIGLGAYVIVSGIWVVAGLRLLGPYRVDRIVGHASVLSRRALEEYRPLRLPSPDQPLRAEIVDVYPAAAPPPVRLPVPEPEPIRPPPPIASASAVAAKPRMPSKWTLPSATLLQAPTAHRIDHGYLSAVARDLGARLQSYKIGATVAPASVQGALVHKFEVTPDVSQEIKPITAKQVDLEAAYKGLRFATMSGTGKLGIEIPVPAAQRKTVAMRDVLDSAAWAETDAALPIALGVTTAGEPVFVDLATCPHLLVAGATGSGKTVGINAMLTSLLMCNSPAEMQLMLIDPKIVEFARYRGLPHLIAPPVTESSEAIDRLQWACEEMDRRYHRFVDVDASDIDAFNAVSGERVPRIVIAIDEYADLSSVAKDQVEQKVIRLAQKARAAGIHVILATQRPSVDVITGAIKANFPSRIAYKVAQREDSKTIIGASGAESLLGCGDSLCRIPQLSIELVRVHGAYLDATEVRAVCNAWKSQTDPSSSTSVVPVKPAAATAARIDELPADAAADGEDLAVPTRESDGYKKSQPDDLYERAVAYAKEKKLVSGRQLSGALTCGFNKAQPLIERMKSEGLLQSGGPNNTYRYIESS